LSRISFNVALGNGIEALAICMDDGLTPRFENENRAETTCLAIGGSTIETVLQNPRLLSTGQDGQIDYSLMDLFPTRSTSVIKYIGFVQVISNDGSIATSPSIVENISFYDFVNDDGQDISRRLNTAVKCPAGELAATMKAGLQDALQPGDFCVPSKIMLSQIELNEGDLCEVNNDCRSGLCEIDCAGSGPCGSNICKSKVRLFHTHFFPCTNSESYNSNNHFLTFSTILKEHPN